MRYTHNKVFQKFIVSNVILCIIQDFLNEKKVKERNKKIKYLLQKGGMSCFPRFPLCVIA